MPLPDIGSDDYYRVLGVSRDSADSDIGRAYKKLALRYHPDKNADNALAKESFIKISDAYEVLSDPEKRKRFDQFGKQGLAPGAGASFHNEDVFDMRMFFGGDGGARVSFARFGAGTGRRSMPEQRRRPTIPLYAMPRGTFVTIRGLAKSQEHNQKMGRIIGWDWERGRYEVDLDGETVLSLRPSNLTQNTVVEIRGIESQPDLNGQNGKIYNFSAEHGRYMVMLSGGRDVLLLPVNAILTTGTRVVIEGLSSAQFNGLMAQIMELDREAMRYTVFCQNGKQIKIKFDNVLC